MLSCWSKLAFQLPGSGSFYQSCTLSATNGSWTMAASVVVSSSAEASSRGVACFYEHKVAHPEVKPNHLVCDIFFTCKSSISTSLSTKTRWLMDVAAPRAGQHLKWESKTNHMAPLRPVVMWVCWSALNHGREKDNCLSKLTDQRYSVQLYLFQKSFGFGTSVVTGTVRVSPRTRPSLLIWSTLRGGQQDIKHQALASVWYAISSTGK